MRAMADTGEHPRVVRVTSEFRSQFDGELSAAVDDIVQIRAKLDKYWFDGESNGRSGQIPIANCRSVAVEPIDGVGVALFAAANDFMNDCVDGDLRFRKGDLIIGLEAIDENWWHGMIYEFREKTGIFPLTHVWRLNDELLPKRKSAEQKSADNSETFGRVLMDMRAQLDTEIDLISGEVVRITENYDKMFFKGESIDGRRRGIFPKSFVKILDDYRIESASNSCNLLAPIRENNSDLEHNDNPPSYENVIRSQSPFPQFTSSPSAAAQPSSLGYSNTIIGEVESYGRALFPFRAEYPNELSFKADEIVHLIRYIDREWLEGEIDGRVGIFPRDYIEIIVDCEARHESSELSAAGVTICEEFPPDSFARVLYDFDAEIDGDLRVRCGDTLTLLRRIDANWLEVMDDSGLIGFVPANHCEIIDENQFNYSRSLSMSTTKSDETDRTVSPIPDNRDEPSIFAKENTGVDKSDNLLNAYTHFPETHLSSTDDETNFDAVGRRSPVAPERPNSSADISPRRPAPPVPVSKHRSQRSKRAVGGQRALEKSETKDMSTNFNRQESIRSSIASNSSSGSGKSDLGGAFAMTNTSVPTAEEQRRAEERKNKVREQRGCVIMELLQTERDYKLNLEVCVKTFLTNRNECRAHGVDDRLLFGNIEEIIEVSDRLVRSLEESTLCKTYEKQRVGKCFLEIADDLKRVYSLYCRNHDDVVPLWQKYEAQPESKQYLQRGLERMRAETNCFDVPAVLIKPVQRILKYPLLLNELVKCTEDGHDDRPDLIAAVTLITDMATDINEFKRRQDLVQKYRKDSSHSFGARFAKLNLHTVLKKSSRLGHRISNTFGLSSSTKDEIYMREVRKFRIIEKTIKIFVKDLQLFVKSTQDFLNQGFTNIESIADYYADKNRQPEVDQLRTTHRVIVGQYWPEFQLAVSRDVRSVLDELLAKFSGPNKLINKREDKLLDYDSCNKKLECNKDLSRQKSLQEQQQSAKNNYEALNSQLLHELPKFSEISAAIFKDSIQAFLSARKQLIGRVAKHYLTLSELPLVVGLAGGTSEDIRETFQIKHNLLVDQLLADVPLLPVHIFPNANAGHSVNPSLSGSELNRKQSSRGSRRSLPSNISVSVAHNTVIGGNSSRQSPQSASERAYLRSRYLAPHLYECRQAYDPRDVLDIHLNRGDLVGIIKRQDPMGSKHRWFVDAGAVQGFAPSSVLEPFHDQSWIAPPPTETADIITSKPPKEQLNYGSTDAITTTSNPTSSLVRHHYKLHSAPGPPLPPRDAGDRETHRYEDVYDDTPPRYNNLPPIDNSDADMLSFDEQLNIVSGNESGTDLDEFDPYAPLARSSSMSATVSPGISNHRYEEIPEDTPNQVSDGRRKSQTMNGDTDDQQYDELFVACYPFKASGDNQLSLEFGQSVLVRHKCDLTGNPEWWFVEDRDGRLGYVPASYLSKSLKR